MITNEKEHARHPSRTYIRWIIFYVILAIIGIWALTKYAQSLYTLRIPKGVITLDIPYTEYLVGERIDFTLTNHYNSTLYVPNHCPSEPLAVYKLNESTNSWERIHETTSGACDTQSRRFSIEPGQSISGNYGLWPDLFSKPGTYRVAAVVDYINAVSYQDFKVIEKPVSGSQSPESAGNSSNSSSSSSQSRSTTSTTQTPSPQTKTVSVSGGSVTLQYTSTTITSVSVAPSAGCTYEKSVGTLSVEVQFKCGGQQTELHLYLSNGQIIQQVEQGD